MITLARITIFTALALAIALMSALSYFDISLKREFAIMFNVMPSI